MDITGRLKNFRVKKYEIYDSIKAGHLWYFFNPCHESFQCCLRYRYQNKRRYVEVVNIIGLVSWLKKCQVQAA